MLLSSLDHSSPPVSLNFTALSSVASGERKRYLIGIGSNLDPHSNVSRALQSLLPSVERCIVSRAIQTSAVGMETDFPFINLAAYIETSLDAVALKARFNAIETSLGRDRTDPLCKVKDRPIDLDILTEVHSLKDCLYAIEDSPAYGRAILFELLEYLLFDATALDQQTVLFNFEGISLGLTPQAIKFPLN
ncbi:2-amino-4-hydroxy-6-hydroxymethyldihydropteridine diphosphokinase [Leptothoe sp. PORK10 BA2]|uniref:2-amino-4-hydroxy-6- hydroxymethyldihydropteridine diphosphokinase n=1 Tax=Leptothoe sp. PORK10 BA2 TaxID=3110254 RepID=UPI002B207AC9|nr:2-amino-4-hydroxy-6-hydroxymethyldihydropteridine diphosphokinase [Leptothoe sp. PORK10 BA2]MEA5466135.1 2-amino-4-hydroxy-6-hydroxymethyldihydropteridine diphosphokinase [Leptothoe sp. PORK10 BA2]